MSKFEKFSDNRDQERNKQEERLRSQIERPHDGHIFNIFERARNSCPELSQQEIIDIFFDMQEYETLAKLSYQYSDVDFRSVATRLVEAGQSKFVLQNIDKFATLEDVVDLLQEMNYLDPATKSEMNSDVFAGTNIKK